MRILQMRQPGAIDKTKLVDSKSVHTKFVGFSSESRDRLGGDLVAR